MAGDQNTAVVSEKLKSVVENRLTGVGEANANTTASSLAMLKLISQISTMDYGGIVTLKELRHACGRI